MGMHFITPAEIKTRYAEADAAYERGDREGEDKIAKAVQAEIDRDVARLPESCDDVTTALDLAAYLADDSPRVFRRLAAKCARQARAGDYGVSLLVALRRTLAAGRPEYDRYGPAIVANVLGALTRPSVV